jgi:hypothetical protein
VFGGGRRKAWSAFYWYKVGGSLRDVVKLDDCWELVRKSVDCQ